MANVVHELQGRPRVMCSMTQLGLVALDSFSSLLLGIILKGIWPDVLGAKFENVYYHRGVKGAAH